MNYLSQVLEIDTKDVLVDNGEDGFWHKSWYEPKYGLKNCNGKWIVAPVFDEIKKTGGAYTASINKKSEKRLFLINANGKVCLLGSNVLEVKAVSNGYYLFKTAQKGAMRRDLPWTYVSNLCKWGLMDNNGNVVVNANFEYEHDVKIKNKDFLLKNVKQNGCGVLELADEGLFLNLKNIKSFKKAIKFYLLKEYYFNKDKVQLKSNLNYQNAQFKKIKQHKMAENLFNVKFSAKNMVVTENVFTM